MNKKSLSVNIYDHIKEISGCISLSNNLCTKDISDYIKSIPDNNNRNNNNTMTSLKGWKLKLSLSTINKDNNQ